MATKIKVAPKKQPDRALGQCYMLLLQLAAEKHEEKDSRAILKQAIPSNGGQPDV